MKKSFTTQLHRSADRIELQELVRVSGFRATVTASKPGATHARPESNRE